MPSPISAYDLIKKAMLHIGVVSGNEVLRAEDANTGLEALNDVLETWSIEGLTVYGSNYQQFTLVPGQATYSIGPGGDFNAIRPVIIEGAFVRINSVDYPIQPWTLEQYAGISFKEQQTQIIERMVFINEFPLATIILYPTPSQALPIFINFPIILTNVAGLSSLLTLPPGYARALQYAVALELAPQYGSPIDVSAYARSTLAKIKRANRTTPVSTMDTAIVGSGSSIFWAY